MKAELISISGPSLGDVMQIRQAVTSALRIAQDLLTDLQDRRNAARLDDPDIFQLRVDAENIVEILGRLQTNTEGYLSDFQLNEIERIIADAEVVKDAAKILGAMGTPDVPVAEEFTRELQEAAEDVEIELVAMESGTIPVRERKADTTEGVLILVGLGILAWVLS